MRYGHKEVQDQFIVLGKKLGYKTQRNFTSSVPTDGVWLAKHPLNGLDHIPIFSIEVIVSESPKVIRGSISTLETVSPTIAVIILHESEITRRLLSKSISHEDVQHRLHNMRLFIEEQVQKSRQRFEIWTDSKFLHWLQLYGIAN